MEGYIIKSFDFNDIRKTLKLEGKKYSFPQLVNPRRVFWEGDYLIVSEKGMSDLLHIINIDRNEHVKIIGENGVGPGEITSVDRIHSDRQTGCFWVYDMQQKIFAKYDVGSESKLAVEQLKQSEEMFLAIDMVWASDTTLMTIRADGNEKFVEYHTDGRILNVFGTWDSMLEQKDIPHNVTMSLHQGPLKVNPDKGKIVKVGLLRDHLEILDRESGEIVFVKGPESVVPEFKVDYSAGYPMLQMESPIMAKNFYIDSEPQNDFIYALYFGKTGEHYLNGEYAKTVMVFDYNGNIISSYELDYSLIAFTVDEKGRRIFGITYDAEPNVVVFDF